LSAELLNGMLEAAIEIEGRRRHTLLLLKVARLKNDTQEVYRLVDELVPESAIAVQEMLKNAEPKTRNRTLLRAVNDGR
jgi:hypothetical protein